MSYRTEAAREVAHAIHVAIMECDQIRLELTLVAGMAVLPSELVNNLCESIMDMVEDHDVKHFWLEEDCPCGQDLSAVG